MKTIIYLLLAIFIFGIIAVGFTHKSNPKNSILIQSVDNHVSPVSLKQAAKIISGRLSDFSSEKYEVSVIPEKNQIQVAFTNNSNLMEIENLLTQKGRFEFYETYSKKELTELLKSDNQLFSMLKSDAENQGAKIGCTVITEIDKVSSYINSIVLGATCKFAWAQNTNNIETCLYALKLYKDKGILLTGNDIESMTCTVGKASGTNEVNFRFKKSAIDIWAEATKRNINNAIAIVLDNKVICAPIVKSEINGGSGIITGDYTQTEVKYIAALGNNGELPVSFKLVK